MVDLKRPGNPKWLVDPDSQRRGDHLRRINEREREVVESLGGKRCRRSGGLSRTNAPAAGARPYETANERRTQGRDGETAEFLVECKSVAAHVQSIGVKRQWLQQISERARASMKDPVMILTFFGMEHASEDWIVMPLSVARRLLGLKDVSFKL